MAKLYGPGPCQCVRVLGVRFYRIVSGVDGEVGCGQVSRAGQLALDPAQGDQSLLELT